MKVHFSSGNDNWKTPASIYNSLNKEFKFNYDPYPSNPHPDIDGLQTDWGTSSFVNPPYSQLKHWLKKSYEQHMQGKTVVLLIPSRTDTKAWHEYVMKASEIRFIKGQLKFGNAKNNAPFPSCVVIFKRTG